MMQYAKAFVGALMAGIASLIVGYSDGTLTKVEILIAVNAFLGALIVVFAVPNKQPATASAAIDATNYAAITALQAKANAMQAQLDAMVTKPQ